MDIPYDLIALIGASALALHHALFTDASRRSKLGVVAVVGASLLIRYQFPRWFVLSTLLQVGASIYMLVHLRIQD